MVENSTNFGKEKTNNSPESKEKTFLQKIYEFFFYFSALRKGLRIYILLQKIINWNIFITNFMTGFYFLIFFGCEYI